MCEKAVLYVIYGIFPRCDHCRTETPLAVGLTRWKTSLRLLFFRGLKKRLCPAEVKRSPKNYMITEIQEDLSWEDGYTAIIYYEEQNIPVLSFSRA